jgi:hypothetical protein
MDKIVSGGNYKFLTKKLNAVFGPTEVMTNSIKSVFKEDWEVGLLVEVDGNGVKDLMDKYACVHFFEHDSLVTSCNLDDGKFILNKNDDMLSISYPAMGITWYIIPIRLLEN